jgi:hypothetical protein
MPAATETPGETRVMVETRPSSEVEALGLPVPSGGETAVLVRFADTVALPREIESDPEQRVVKSVTATTNAQGRVWAVLGVDGAGCYAIQAPAWDDPSTQNTPFVDITVDVRR